MMRLISIPYTFVLMNLAAVVALMRFARGTHDVWTLYRTGR